MSRYLLLFFLGLGLLQAPALLTATFAQEEDDDEESTFEVEDDGSDDEETTRKKNAGLAGGGARDDGDPGAPKVKISLQQQINKAIKEGVKYLKKAQLKDGSWPPPTANRKYGSKQVIGDTARDFTSSTAFALYCLAKCGVSKKDRTFRKGLKWLKAETMVVHDMTGNKNKDHLGRPTKKALRALTTYESAAIIMLIEAMNEKSAKLTGKHKKRRLYTKNPKKRPKGSRIPDDEWEWLHNRVLSLTKGRTISMSSGGGRRGGRGGPGGGKSTITIAGHQLGDGGWRYGQKGGGGQKSDLSATQFALLGLRAASQAGYPMDVVAPKVWARAATWTKKVQVSGGGFAYWGSEGWKQSMTACGIVSLVICKEQMELSKQAVPGWMEGSIKSGIEALGNNFNPTHNTSQSGHAGHNYYYMYGVERAGDIVGKREFGGKDWYVRGARFLVGAQQQGGKWVDGTAYKPHDVLGTTFALLFLKRATPPTITSTG